MNHKTFVGYSNQELSIAVVDAYKDYDQWLANNRYTVVIEGPAATTATMGVLLNDAEYWFTLTITYREA